MKDKEPKIHPLVKAGSFVSTVVLAACQAGSAVSPTRTPETISTGTSPALIVEPPVGFEPSTPTPEGVSTLPGAETPTPTESTVAAFRAPTFEELIVPTGEGGPLPKYAQGYYNVMDRAKADIVQKVGVDLSKVKIRYWDNTGSKDDFGWMLYYQIEGAGVIWPLKPDGTLADYSTYFEGQVQPDGSIVNLRINSDYNNWVVAGDKNTAAIFGGTLPVIVDSPKDADVAGETKLVYSRWIRPGGQPVDYAKDFSEWQITPGLSEPTPTETPTQTPTPEATEIVWDLTNPEAFPTKPFEYLTSTEFAQQVLDWEAAGKFPEVPDTAIPVHSIDVLPDSGKAFLAKYGLTSIYNFTKEDVNAQIYQGNPEKIPYTLAGVWKTEYQGEDAFFILKKWKNWDETFGFEGFIYKSHSTNPKAISFELIDTGFGSKNNLATGQYFLEGTIVSEYGNSGCGAYFKYAGGDPDSAFCNWYFTNPNIVFNKEFYDRWEKTGVLSNFITENGQKTPFIPISPIGGVPFNANQ